MKNALLIFLFGILAAVAVRADRVDDYVLKMMREKRIPGAAVAVVKNNKVIKMRGYGVANLEFGVPVTTDTAFEIGSVTKQITGAAILLLVEDGRVQLDAPIARYLPNVPDTWRDVTVRHLLTHTSGIRSYTAIGAGFALSQRLTRDQFIQKLAAYPLDFAPGTKYSYCNSGYNLLGHIIEAASGKTYWNFLNERMLRPLGMPRTFDRDPKLIIPRRATGYELDKETHIGRDYDLTDLYSAGAVVSTIADLVRWESAWRDNRLFSAVSVAESQKPFQLADGSFSNYGLGWNVAPIRGLRTMSHSGATAGFSSQIIRFPEQKVAVIVLTNLGDKGFAGPIARGMAEFFVKFPEPDKSSSKPQ